MHHGCLLYTGHQAIIHINIKLIFRAMRVVQGVVVVFALILYKRMPHDWSFFQHKMIKGSGTLCKGKAIHTGAVLSMFSNHSD